MSDFWLGVTVTLAVYYALQTVLSAALVGRQIEVDRAKVATNFAFMVVAFVLANLVYMGLLG